MSEITVGGLSQLIHVEKTQRFENQNLVVQVIKTKQSNTTNSLELHLSDKEHIFVGIVKINNPSVIPLYSIIKLIDFSINFPKRFLSIVDFQVVDSTPNEIIISGKNLSYHPVYKKQDQNQQQNQQQQQQSSSTTQQPQQRSFRANVTGTPTKSLPIPKLNQGTKQPQSSGSTSQNYNRQTIDPETLKTSQITEINDITEGQKSQTIKAMVMSRFPIKSWDKGGSNSGQLFSAVLQDNSGEIKVTCFSTSTSSIPNFTELYEQFNEKNVLIIHNYSSKKADPQFNKLRHHCEITINSSSTVLPVNEEIVVSYDFTPIGNLQGAENTFYDVIGVVSECNLKQPVTSSKTQSQLIKSSLNITDTTGTIEVIFWNEKAELDVKAGDILAVKSAKLNDYNNNKTLSASFCEVNNFTIAAAAQLRSQKETESLFSGPSLSKGNTSSNYINYDLPIYVLKSLPESSPLYKVNQKGQYGQKAQFRVVGHLFRIPPYIKTSELDNDKKYLDWYYDACTACKKSQASHENGTALCNNPNREKSYKMQFKLADDSDNISIDVLGNTCRKLLEDTSAEELFNKSPEEINRLFTRVLGELYEVTIQVSTYESMRDDQSYTGKRYTATQIQKVTTETYKNIIDDSFNQCRLFNKD